LDKNTLVIFTSDNGPHTEGGADPDFFNTEKLLRGTKRSTTEGGIRVPFIAWWPGQVEAGTVNDHQLAFYDIMPTFCEVAGIENYVERYTNPRLENDYFDGLSFAPTLLGEGEQDEHEFLYWEFHETNMMALRMGDWKLVVRSGNCELYDLATDLHEDNNLAAQYPEVVAKMKEILLREHTESDIPKFRQLTLPQ
jgi:arylsulfatase A-like enzyme